MVLSSPRARVPRAEWIAAASMVALLLLKLWLVAWQMVGAEGSARFDDALFVELAQHVKAGDWLGPYNERTLVKGAMYPIWIAATSTLRLPLLPAQHALHALAAAAIAFALRRVIPNPWARLALFAVLIFDPTTYEYTATRVTREGIYTPLAMFIATILIELVERKPLSTGAATVWSALLGLVLGIFWLTREEGPWILPLVGVLLLYFAAREWRSPESSNRIRVAVAIIVPVFVGIACVASVALINYRHYGVATVVELKSPWFEGAYGALSRVGPENYVRLVPVPKPSRELAYGASPAFAELRARLDGDASGQTDESTLSRFGEMNGTWFIWAFREAAATAGHHESLPRAREYYRSIAEEINDACASGEIPCGPTRASLAPPWRGEYFPDVVRAMGKLTNILLSMNQVKIEQFASVGDDSLLKPFAETTNSPLERLTPADASHGVLRKEALGAARDFYALTLYPVTIVAGVWLLAGTALDLRRRTPSPALVIAWACVAGIGARIALLAYISVSSYPIYQLLYLRVLYPLVYVAAAMCFAHAVAWSRSQSRS